MGGAGALLVIESLGGRPRTITRALGEMAVVVLSILLAFALDSWWDERGAAARRGEVLETIRADFTTMQPALRTEIEDGDSLVARGYRLLAALHDPRSAGADSIQPLFDAIMNPVGRVPLPPTYQAALSAPDLGLFDHPELLRALALLEEADQGLAEHYRVSADIFYTGPLARLMERIGSADVLLGFDEAPERFRTEPYLDLVAEPDVYAAASRAVVVNQNLLWHLVEMEEALAAAIAALSAATVD